MAGVVVYAAAIVRGAARERTVGQRRSLGVVVETATFLRAGVIEERVTRARHRAVVEHGTAVVAVILGERIVIERRRPLVVERTPAFAADIAGERVARKGECAGVVDRTAVGAVVARERVIGQTERGAVLHATAGVAGNAVHDGEPADGHDSEAHDRVRCTVLRPVKGRRRRPGPFYGECRVRGVPERQILVVVRLGRCDVDRDVVSGQQLGRRDTFGDRLARFRRGGAARGRGPRLADEQRDRGGRRRSRRSGCEEPEHERCASRTGDAAPAVASHPLPTHDVKTRSRAHAVSSRLRTCPRQDNTAYPQERRRARLAF